VDGEKTPVVTKWDVADILGVLVAKGVGKGERLFVGQGVAEHKSSSTFGRFKVGGFPTLFEVPVKSFLFGSVDSKSQFTMSNRSGSRPSFAQTLPIQT
jgi:hypothetical protein